MSDSTSWAAVAMAAVTLLGGSGLLASVAAWLKAKARALEAEADRDATLAGLEVIEDEDAKTKAKAAVKRTRMLRQRPEIQD